MSDADKLAMVQVMVDNPNISDGILTTYLQLAGEKVIQRAYPYDSEQTEVPARYSTLQCEIAAYMINRRGSEGQTSHSENNILRSYEGADVPKSLLNHITPMVGVIP